MTGSRSASRILLVLAAGATLLGVILEGTGGFTTHVFGVRISAHGSLRPILLGLLCAAASFRLMAPSAQDAAIARAFRVSHRGLPLLTAAAAACVLTLGLAYGTRAAGGSDPYGYISQSQLWMAGDLRIHQDFVASVPWPNADWTFTPLGYRPSANHTLVPTYAPGLPLVMALFTTVTGSCGPYLVNPICAALLVILTYFVGVRVGGRAVGAAAALCVASSPTLLFMSLWPMSDVPVATFWTASLLLACVSRGTLAAIAGSGAAAGAAIAIRPNLAPLALLPAIVAIWPVARADTWRAVRGLALFGLTCAPFVLFIAWLYNDLYGSPLQSGYGDSSTIFAWKNLRPNLARYPRWLWDTEGPLVFLFLLSPFLPKGPSPSSRALRWSFTAVIAAVLASYLWYLPFDAWWFLRFLLPALPLVFVLAADAVWQGSRPFGNRVRVLALLAFTLITVNFGVTRAREYHVWELGDGEQKYADVGRYIAARLPADAVIITMQHSGSVRYYSGRLTLRYDSLESGWLDRAIAHLRASGHEPYLLLEKWEVPLFRERFATEASVRILDGPPIAEHLAREVMLYRTDSISLLAQPDPIPNTAGEGCQSGVAGR